MAQPCAFGDPFLFDVCCKIVGCPSLPDPNFEAADLLHRLFFQNGSFIDIDLPLTDPAAIENFLNALGLPFYSVWKVTLTHVAGENIDLVTIAACRTEGFDESDLTTAVDYVQFTNDSEAALIDSGFARCIVSFGC